MILLVLVILDAVATNKIPLTSIDCVEADDVKEAVASKVKILATGELKSKLTFKVNAVSDKAKAAIEAAGGSVEVIK
jgi:ribosomal protein L15